MSLLISTDNSDPAAIVVRLQGRLLLGPDCAALEALVDRAAASPAVRLVFDLSGLTHMDSTGMGRFIDAHQKLQAGGKSMRAAGAAGGVREMFRVTKLDTVLHLYPSLAEALAAP